MVRSRQQEAWKSQSTTSTSSLAQLHEKLAHLPCYNFEKEAVHVCALPELSTVTEVSEPDDRHSFASVSTTKINRPYGVCQKKFIDANVRKEKNSQSDREIQKKSKIGRNLSPSAHNDENSTTCLLVATIGSDESVISETLERFNKSKNFQGDNIVDLIVQEALNRDQEKCFDSRINIGDNRKTLEQENSEVNSDTKVVKKTKPDCEKTCTVISNTTTDESNDVVNDTPLNFVNVTKRKKEFKENPRVILENTKERPVFDEKVVEDFFTQHLNENQRGEVVISPTLARKINESSSDSEHFDECLLIRDPDTNAYQIEIKDIEIIECLNCIIDKVCNDLEKCTEMFDKELNNIKFLDEQNIESIPKTKSDSHEVLNAENINTVSGNAHQTLDMSSTGKIEKESIQELAFKCNTNINKKIENNIEKRPLRASMTPKRSIKLRYPTKKTEKTRANPKNKYKKIETKVSKMLSIMEAQNVTDVTEKEKCESESNNSLSNKPDCNTSLFYRKRKLYSPKEGEDMGQKQNKKTSAKDEDNDFKTTKVESPHFKATSYKDIEEDRQKFIRKPRTRNSSKMTPTLSPRTTKMNDMFDHVKDKIESNAFVILADKELDRDLAEFNLTSDSEDEDFKQKKFEKQKRINVATEASGDLAISTRHGRKINRINYSENRSPDEVNKKSVQKPKRTRRKRQTQAKLIKKEHDLVDERMRKAAVEELNTSFIISKPLQKPTEEPALILNKQPDMIAIPDESAVDMENKYVDTDKNMKKNKRTDALSLKKDKTKNKVVRKEIIGDDGTESPLPGLLVETMSSNVNDHNDSISVNMLLKMQKLHREGPEISVTETNTTQNLIGDLDRIICSPPPMNITEEFNKIEIETIMDETDVQERPTNREITKKEAPIEKKLTSKATKKIKKEHTRCNKYDDTEIIEISCTEDKSDKSISTVGNYPIRAHGDSNELPPDSNQLTQKYEHRDLEVEDFDQSIKDYFNKLRNEVVPNARASSSDNSREIVIEIPSTSKEKSPVISIKRLSNNDISKWLPSRRNSDTDSNYSSHSKNCSDKKHTEIEPVIEYFNIISETNLISERSKSGSKNFILEDSNSADARDINQLNLSMKSFKMPEISKCVEEKSPKQKKWLRSHNIQDTQRKSISEQEFPNSERNARKSIISPIKMFDDIFPPSTVIHYNDENDIANSVTGKKKKDKGLRINSRSSEDVKEKENIEISSPLSKISTARINADASNRLKRKSESNEKDHAKRRLLESTVAALSGSERSSPSVMEWFKKNTPLSRVENVNESLVEVVENVMEKLDTTLAEIHQNTSKSFIHMFVNAQNRLTTVRQERRQMFKEIASNILGEVVKILDSKFGDIERRSQEMDAEFMKQLKSQALQLIQDDCKKKQVMVSILREDVQAVLDHMKQMHTDDN